MAKHNTKSYSKFTFDDLRELGLQTVIVDLFEGENIPPVQPSEWLKEAIEGDANFSLNTEKAKSEFIIAPVLNELYQNNQTVFSVYSGFNFNVDAEKGLQGFCDFLLAKLPLGLSINKCCNFSHSDESIQLILKHLTCIDSSELRGLFLDNS